MIELNELKEDHVKLNDELIEPLKDEEVDAECQRFHRKISKLVNKAQKYISENNSKYQINYQKFHLHLINMSRKKSCQSLTCQHLMVTHLNSLHSGINLDMLFMAITTSLQLKSFHIWDLV